MPGTSPSEWSNFWEKGEGRVMKILWLLNSEHARENACDCVAEMQEGLTMKVMGI
jgi:hypothetical protein